MKRYEIFISYRRAGAEDFARAVYQDLRHKGYKVFLDRQDLLSGEYEQQVLHVIENCRDVVIILPVNALDRCQEESDLFRKEISRAIQCNKNIISIIREGFQFPPAESLPEEIRKFPKYEAILENPNAYDGVLNRLCLMLKESKKRESASVNALLKKSLLILTAVILLSIAGISGYSVYQKQQAVLIEAYVYPREPSVYLQRIIEDPGNLQNLYLNLSQEKLFAQLDIEPMPSANPSKDICEYLTCLKGDVISFPFNGKPEILGEYEDFGEYTALLLCYFYHDSCEYYAYTLGTDDQKEALNMMKKLYAKYNNGTGEMYKDTCIIYNVRELGGTLYMHYGKNTNGKNCFFFKVYQPVEPEEQEETETEEIIGDVSVADYAGKEYSTYSFGNHKVSAKGTISYVQFERTKSSVNIVLEGEKTYDASGENSSNTLIFRVRLVNSEGIIVKTEDVYSPKITTGEKFRTTATIYINDEEQASDLIIEIQEANN